ncbi:Ubiquitin carboxyl-terminal hydrolase [Quillaja saponaria]|uniref:Ubiquitin carboxyl-terminal hydrolase n=1 Tax=Quillaja saponaria TaxID=32244 RepID=A0AAD7Q7E7_QUISA|nr:Ubiquitin carboxyl-terminal hydrolase [Quillaja saponaria]
MDDLFANDGDYLLDSDSHSHSRFPDEEDSDFGNEKVDLVSYRRWKEAHSDADQIEGVLYSVSSNYDADLEIVLDLRKKEDYRKSENAEVEFSGCQYALVTEGMWLLAQKRLNDFNSVVRNIGSDFHAEYYGVDVFPLQIRLSVSWETNSLVVKISQKDNVIDFYKKACKFFCLESKPIVLELQVHGLSDSLRDRYGTNNINYENPLGMKGELALTFGGLLRKLWFPGSSPVPPRMFKTRLSNFFCRFSGNNQHDSHELLALLLDGLHEDLNRIKCKPYSEVNDAEGRPVEEVAEEYWRNHLARNDSIIVDLFQGQFQSTLVCPVCHKVSITFDPFMYLSLPLPSTTKRSMTLTMLTTDGVTFPCTFTLMVPKHGRLKDLIDALSAACSLRDDETLCLRNHLIPDLIRDEDKLVAYRLKKETKESPLVVFLHQKLEGLFGIPVVAKMSNLSCGSYIRREFLKLTNPFLLPTQDQLAKNDDDMGNVSSEYSEMDDPAGPTALDSDVGSDGGTGDDMHLGNGFKFYLVGMGGEKFV